MSVSYPSDLVSEALRAQGYLLGRHPTLGDPEQQRLWTTLLREEVSEVEEAIAEGDLTALADALGDVLYVAYGASLVFGLPIREVFEEIHRSNMTKVGPDGKRRVRADGKVMKGDQFDPPRLGEILARHADL